MASIGELVRQRARNARRRLRKIRIWKRVKASAQRLAKRVRNLGQRIRRKRRRRRLAWPSGSFTELLYHDPPHLHIASADRGFLIAICRIAEQRYGLRVGEFPPFDPVEAVHVDGSWHYRDSASPHVPRSFAGRGDGLAADLNGDREYEFYRELEARYG